MPRDTFEFTGQSFAGAVPTGRSLVVLDTNVLSILETVARKGFRMEELAHRRAAHLLRWLHARPNDQIFTLFGVIEGAGFGSGGISSYQVLRRTVATAAVIAWARDHIDEMVKTTEPLPQAALRAAIPEVDPALDFARTLLPLTVLPCYVASLATAAAWRGQGPPLAKAQRVHDRLEESLQYIPIFGWLSAVHLFLGTGSIRNKVETSVFKLRAPDLRRSCMSAAWDLGYLQLMSLARVPALHELFDGRSPVLVTDDRQLPWAHSLLTCQDNTEMFAIEPTNLDPRFESEALALVARNQQARSARGGSLPDWDRCAAAASALQHELSLDDAPELRLDHPVRTFAPELRDVEAYLYALACSTADAALKKLEQDDGDALFGGIVALHDIVVDNAKVRGRSVSDSWDALITKLGPEASDLQIVQLAIRLPRALAEENWRLFNAMLEMLSAEGSTGWVMIYQWHLGRLVVKDTAVALDISVEDLVALLQSNLRDSWL